MIIILFSKHLSPVSFLLTYHRGPLSIVETYIRFNCLETARFIFNLFTSMTFKNNKPLRNVQLNKMVLIFKNKDREQTLHYIKI